MEERGVKKWKKKNPPGMMTIFRGILFIQLTFRLNGHFIFYFIIHFLESQSTQDFWERMKQLCSTAHFLSRFTAKDIL